eukprot:scaffold773_cov114-Isochrysis_galbana.AAC.2
MTDSLTDDTEDWELDAPKTCSKLRVPESHTLTTHTPLHGHRPYRRRASRTGTLRHSSSSGAVQRSGLGLCFFK